MSVCVVDDGTFPSRTKVFPSNCVCKALQNLAKYWVKLLIAKLMPKGWNFRCSKFSRESSERCVFGGTLFFPSRVALDREAKLWYCCFQFQLPDSAARYL
jgi:hypothetical protein